MGLVGSRAMKQPGVSSPPPHQGSEDLGNRENEGRAAVQQMDEENREGLAMKVIAVMVQRYGVLPKALWDLNSVSDMGAGRGFTYREDVSEATFRSVTSNERYTIIALTFDRCYRESVSLPDTLERLHILGQTYDYPLDLPVNLQELTFDRNCEYSQPFVLPDKLRYLKLADVYNLPLNLPLSLLELELGPMYQQPLVLPPRLKRLTFDPHSSYDLPLALPSGISCLDLGMRYNAPTALPSGIEEIRVGTEFARDLSLPSSLRKIEWWCNHPIQIPEGVLEVEFSHDFNQPVDFPRSVRKLRFLGNIYSHPLTLPSDLQELEWHVQAYDGLVLPESLHKLTWASPCYVALPLGLAELVVRGEAPLILPEGLLKVTLNYVRQAHYDLPASVQEVSWSKHTNRRAFTHPATLRHLIVRYCDGELDLSCHRIYKVTLEDCYIRIKAWPQGLKELAFTRDDMLHPLRVPYGCRIVGEMRPENLIMDDVGDVEAEGDDNESEIIYF